MGGLRLQISFHFILFHRSAWKPVIAARLSEEQLTDLTFYRIAEAAWALLSLSLEGSFNVQKNPTDPQQTLTRNKDTLHEFLSLYFPTSFKLHAHPASIFKFHFDFSSLLRKKECKAYPPARRHSCEPPQRMLSSPSMCREILRDSCSYSL